MIDIKAILESHSVWLQDYSGAQRADFSNRHLEGADFSKTILSGANFSEADCTDVNFELTDCRSAMFIRSRLIAANMKYANLMHAIFADLKMINCCLEGANIRYLEGSSEQIRVITGLRWRVIFTDDDMAIGCKQLPIREWRTVSDGRIALMSHGALDFWKENKKLIFAFIEKSGIQL